MFAESLTAPVELSESFESVGSVTEPSVELPLLEFSSFPSEPLLSSVSLVLLSESPKKYLEIFFD
ncbi:hypothetical protein [Companilactobacillus keshanensis]|uniref:hypothetical protein n=1 Tax=Companilactobacillus keshanensis TaxID=2486003 RepID=UPI0013DDF08B|nr:hypothetical protein [Companilactobacillus keshanensis]